MSTIYDILIKACFKEDYSFFRRNLERDQVKSEKAFWMAAIEVLHRHDKFPFFIVHKLYTDLLYDRPALELTLSRHLSTIHKNNISPNQNDIQHLQRKCETAAYIRSEVTDVLTSILENCDQKSIQIDLETSKEHQPYLPSPVVIVQHLYDVAYTQVNASSWFYPNSNELSLAQLHTIQKKVTSYFPYFLLQVGLDKLSLESNSNTAPPEFRKYMPSISEAVKIHITGNPWQLALTNAQLSHIIHHKYSGRRKSSNGKIVEDLFNHKSIQKAIQRFRGQSN